MSRIALVTGAGTGVGRTIAAALSGAGFIVVLTGRREAVLREAAGELVGESIVHAADVSDAVEVDELFDMVRSRFGRLDLLVNNAGIAGPTALLEDIEPTEWDQTVAVNLTATFLCARAAFRIACGQIDIGNARTPMTIEMDEGVLQADGTIAAEPTMDVTHVGDAVVYMANLPLSANVPSMTVMATKMPFAGRG